MKTWKLVSGVISSVLCLLVMLQSCAAGLLNTMEENGDVSGSAGTLVAILMLSGGIVSIVTRNSDKKGGDIALIVLFGLAGLIGVTLAGEFTDLYIWATWCIINAILAIVHMSKLSKAKE